MIDTVTQWTAPVMACVQPTGSTWTFDTYVPPAAPTAQVVVGPTGAAGPACSTGTGTCNMTVPIVLPANPTTALQAATKQYVDSATAPLLPANGVTTTPGGGLQASTVVAPLTSQSGVIAISGNSWCAGEGVYSPAQSYPALLASMHGTGIRKDACYESNQAADDAVAVLANYQKTVTPAVFPEPLYIEVEGNNDAVYCNGGTSTTAGCEANFVMAYTAEQAYEGLPRTAMTYAQDAGCTETTGTWSNDNIYQVGMGEIASSTGATLTCNFTSTGGAVAEVFGAIDGSAGTATIRIDGGTSTTLNAFGNSGQTIATLRQLTYSPFGVLLTGISAGSHTAVITVTSAPVQASLTTYSAVGNGLITFPVTNSFSAGTVGTFSGFSANLTSLNGCTGKVSATGLSGSNFEVLYYGNPVNCPPLVTSSGSETGTFSTNFFTQLFVGSPAAASNTSLVAGVWKEYADTTSAQTSAYDALVSGLSSTLNAGGFNTTFIPMRGGALNYGSDFLAVPYCSGVGNGGGGHANCIGAAHVAKQFQVTRPDLFQPYAGSNPYFAGPIQVQTTNTNGYYGYGSFNNFAGGNSQGTGVFQTTALNSGILISNFGNGIVSGITEVPWNGSNSAMALFENGGHAIVLCTELSGPTKWWTAKSSDITGTLSGQTLSQCPFVFTPGNGAFHATHVYADTDLYLAGALFTPVSANSPLVITTTTTPQIKAAYDGTHNFSVSVDANGVGYLNPSGSTIMLQIAGKNLMQIASGGFYEYALGTAVSGTNYASPSFFTTASAYISGAAVNVQLSDYLNFNTMSSTPTYSAHQLVNNSATLPMVTEMVGTAGHYLDLNLQASTSYVLNHASDMFYATDKYAPAWYANSVLSFGLGYTGTTAATSCGSLSGAAGCLTVPIAGVTHYVPFF